MAEWGLGFCSGERSACYSADHLLRQYKRVRGERNKHFSYKEIKSVHTIVFFEKSPREFFKFPKQYLHSFRQRSDTGLEMELLQEYYFLSLDIYAKNMENKAISSELEAWLGFLSFDAPERILELINGYPKFKAMYQDIYEICRNMERVMNVYSKELEELDQKEEELNQKEIELDRLKEELRLVKLQIEKLKNEKQQG